jgi:hypothetical protein
MDKECRLMRKLRNAYKVFIGESKTKRLIGKPRCKWEVNIKMDLKGINNADVDWIHLDLNRNKFWALVTQN